jgi:hypothetical protein
LAEDFVAADPAKKVFWSTCYHSKEWCGFFAKVHYVIVVADGDQR